MTPEAILATVQRVLIEEFEIERTLVVPTARLRDDLGLDSLDALDLVVALEKQFSCDISETDAQSIRTVGDVCSRIATRLGEEGGTPA